MSIDIPNKIYYDNEYDNSVIEVLDKFIYSYKNEFALRKFVANYFDALENLKHVSKYDGRPSDETLLNLGLRRMKIKRSKYVIVYTYRDGAVVLHRMEYSGRDFSKIFY